MTFAPPTRRCLWHAKHFISAIGWPGVAALALFAFSTAFVVFAIHPLQAKIDVMQRDAKNLRMQSKTTPSEQKTLNPAEQLAQFYRFFPKQETASDWMAKLYNAAAQQNLNLEQGDYRLVHDRDGKLTHYDIDLPVKGGYVQVRKFVAQALADVPNLALHSITFSKQKIGDVAVDAQLKFTLYLSEQ